MTAGTSSNQALSEARLLPIARIWCLIAAPLLLFYLWQQLEQGWTDGQGHPFGEDFINFWSGAWLAQNGHWALVYDLNAFHRFEQSVVGAPLDFYHYSYPPVTWLLTAPFGALPYLAAWAAWQFGGMLTLALAIRRIAPAHWKLLALAPPAIFINAMGGQNGCWTASAIGWGLILLKPRPLLAGAILALFVIKPQLGWLIPLALLAGRQWRALGAFLSVAAALLLVSVGVYGPEAWLAYLEQGQTLKAVILEDGSGTWHRMLSVFVFVRHAGAPVASAYIVQAVASAVVAALVAMAWHKGRGNEWSSAVLVLGMLAGSLYVSDYDCVMLVLAACWLWPIVDNRGRTTIALAMLAPLVTASLASESGLALCAILLWPPLFWAARSAGHSGNGGSARLVANRLPFSRRWQTNTTT